MAQWIEEQDYIQVADAKIIEDVIYKGRGRPKHDSQSEKVYRVSGQLTTSLRQKETKEDETGCFIIATNDIDIKLTMEEFLSHYISQ